nr:transposon tf2-11 polyprotein [Quercus suber]
MTKKLSPRQGHHAEELAQYDLEIIYRPGGQDPVDGLSHRPDYYSGEDEDSTMLTVLQKMIRRLRQANARQLIKDIMVRNHDDPSAGHYGVENKTSRICGGFYWKGQRTDIKRHVAYCDICQRHKAKRHQPYRELQFLLIPQSTDVLKHWSLDFVTGLLPARSLRSVVDAVLVLVDRLSELSIFVPVASEINVKDFADVVEQICANPATRTSLQKGEPAQDKLLNPQAEQRIEKISAMRQLLEQNLRDAVKY